MTPEMYAQAIRAHYAANWRAPIAERRWSKGPVDALPAEFRVLVAPRSGDVTAYATVCMSQPDDVFGRIELHLLARRSKEPIDELVELLTTVAHYHRTGHPLGIEHSVNFGRPWLPGSRCQYGLISLPYLDGPKLEQLDELGVRFLWLIPITEAEIRFKKTAGMEALEELFEKKQFDYLNPLRTSVV
jgi:hypothetical protein